MADTKTSDLGAAGAITGAELLALVQAGVNKQSTPDALKTYYDTIFAQLAGLTSQAFACSNLAFPSTAVPSADPNTLDDYEEGTWTPILSPGSGSGQTYTIQNGHYVKIGNRVWISCNLTMAGLGTAAGISSFGGLPFVAASVNVGDTVHFGGCTGQAINAGESLTGYFVASEVQPVIWEATTGTNLYNLSTDSGATPSWTFSGSYQIA